MDKRIAQNALNFLLSDRFTYKGPDVPALVEIIGALNQEVNNGAETYPPSGPDQAED